MIALNLIQELTEGSNWSPKSWACNLDLLATTSVCKMIAQVARWKATSLQIVMVWLGLTVHMNPTVLIWDASLSEWGVDSTGWQLVGVAWRLCYFAVKLLFCVTICGRMLLNLWRWTFYIYRQQSQWFITNRLHVIANSTTYNHSLIRLLLNLFAIFLDLADGMTTANARDHTLVVCDAAVKVKT